MSGFYPSGVGKSTFGARACKELGLRFLDLAEEPRDPEVTPLSAALTEGAADVIELPWLLQLDKQALRLACQSGEGLLLWAHPEDMQARFGHEENLFTPVPRLKLRGGFGRNGTGCREFRIIDRACEQELESLDARRSAA